MGVLRLAPRLAPIPPFELGRTNERTAGDRRPARSATGDALTS